MLLELQISSEEETSSNLSRLIFYNNWKGIYSQVCASLRTTALSIWHVCMRRTSMFAGLCTCAMHLRCACSSLVSACS